MKLLICTQAIDLDDRALGFFHRWVEVFAPHYDEVTVVCLSKGRMALPQHVRVFSLGKEKGERGRFSYAARFLRLVWREKERYDAVFVHMNQEYVLLAGLLWKALGKKVFLWRNHAHGTTLTNVAVALSNAVFCTSPHSYTARFKKTTLMPVGIDAVCVEGDAGERNERSLLVLGRVAPVKRVGRILEAVRLLPQDVAQGLLVNIVGDALPEHADYMASLRAFAEKLDNGVRVVFAPGVSHAQTALLYAAHGVYVNATPPGSFDKTMLEAMVCGATVVATNDAIAGVLGPLAPRGDDAHGLARSIEHALRFSGPERQAHRVAQRAYVADQHSLDALSVEIERAVHAPYTPSHMDMLLQSIGDPVLLGRYIVSGAFGIATNLSVLFLLTDFFGVWYMYSAMTALVSSLCVAFALQKLWTFRAGGNTSLQFVSYSLIALGGMGCSMALLYVLVEYVGMWYVVAQMCALCVVGIVSFIMNRNITFGLMNKEHHHV